MKKFKNLNCDKTPKLKMFLVIQQTCSNTQIKLSQTLKKINCDNLKPQID